MDDVEREIWAGQNGYELERPWNWVVMMMISMESA
jgi:hypothetical protein